MHYEYLIFNIIVIAGPLIFGMLKPYYFIHRWRNAFISIIVVGTPFIIWDSLVTGTHWMFNQAYILGIYFFNLPLEEWLFFLTVPFACLYTWEMISKHSNDQSIEKIKHVRKWLYLMIIPGIVLFAYGLEYTGLVFIFLTISVLIDQILKTDLIVKKRFYYFLAMIIGFTLIFNGFLTWRPVVLYGEEFQIGFRIITIPIEDFGYGIALLFLNTSIFEKLNRMKQASLKPA